MPTLPDQNFVDMSNQIFVLPYSLTKTNTTDLFFALYKEHKVDPKRPSCKEVGSSARD